MPSTALLLLQTTYHLSPSRLLLFYFALDLDTLTHFLLYVKARTTHCQVHGDPSDISFPLARQGSSPTWPPLLFPILRTTWTPAPPKMDAHF